MRKQRRQTCLSFSASLQGVGSVGGLLAITDHGSLITHHFPLHHGNGNITEYINSSATVVAHYQYDPFGNTTVASEVKANDFAYRFSTKPLDSTTGFYYYGYRYYDPLTGRWPSRDPIEESGGLNLYGFVGNNGVNWWDLFGLSTETENNSKVPVNNDWQSAAPLQSQCNDSCKNGCEPIELVFYDSRDKDIRSFALGLNPQPAIGVRTVNQILEEIRARIKKCQCLKKITIVAHGSDAERGGFGLGAGGRVDTPELSSKFARLIKPVLCQNSEARLYGCYSAAGDAAVTFAKEAEITVIGFTKLTQISGGTSINGGPYNDKASIGFGKTVEMRGALWNSQGGLQEIDPTDVKKPRPDLVHPAKVGPGTAPPALGGNWNEIKN